MPRSYENNFDFLRLLLAAFVIITHGYQLSGDNEPFEPLGQLTCHQLTFSQVGLAGFFSISGFLILQSLRASNTLTDYFKKRILRIYPGFIVALLITVVVGYIVTGFSITQFFSDPSPWEYFFYKLTLFGPNPHNMKNVFAHNPSPGSANGSLWTIPYEFLFYILLMGLFVIRKKQSILTGVVIVLFVLALFFTKAFGTLIPIRYYVTFLSPLKSFDPSNFLTFGTYFIMGACLNVFQKQVYRYNKVLAVSSFFIALIFIHLHHFGLARLATLPVLIVSFGTMRTKGLSGLSNRIGDLSYGIYIYSYLIQQVLMQYFTLHPLQLIIATLPIAVFCGWLSWHLVEKRALQFKEGIKKVQQPNPTFITLTQSYSL